MKSARKSILRKRTLKRRLRSHHQRERGGSALMITMVLLGMLSLLGVIFYTFAAQERSNAAYYSDAAKNAPASSLSADALFDWALEQIIVGTDTRLTNSMLWGSRYSMLSNALGFGVAGPGDLHPFNGEGLNLIYDSNGNVAVDQNRNGLPDDGSVDPDRSYLLDYNDSPAAPKLNDPTPPPRQLTTGATYFPQPDVGATYPDANSIFLTYVGKVRDQNGNVHQVVKPAYMVPGLLRKPDTTVSPVVSRPLGFEDANFNGSPDPGEDLAGDGLDDWCVNPRMASRVMRAHPSHVFVRPNGTPTTTPRYLNTAQAVAAIGTGAHGFPFHPMDPTYNTTTAAGEIYVKGGMGPYSKIGIGPGNDDPIQFDYDNDGDGINESVLMDLDFPPQEDSSGKLYVPLFLVSIYDLDSLINLNVHGNLAKLLYGPSDVALADVPIRNTANPFGYTNVGAPKFYYVSQSNLGLGPSEINPLWALTGRPGIDNGGASTIFTAHQSFYGVAPAALAAPNPLWGETANMEFTWSKIGRVDTSVSGSPGFLPGAYGEEGVLYNAYTNGTIAAAGGQSLPRPGTSLYDDNLDVNEGVDNVPYYQQPLDYTGMGSYWQTADPKKINWFTPGGGNLNQWIAYDRYENSGTTAPTSNIRWGSQPGLNLMTNSFTQGLGDDPNEIAYYGTTNNVDRLFTPDEIMYLQLSNAETTRLHLSSRLQHLFPFNFANDTTDNARGSIIRRKFTTESNDRKSFGFPFSLRSFGNIPPFGTSTTGSQEYNRDFNTSGTFSGTFRFPPQFGQPSGGVAIPRFDVTSRKEDPFRPETREILEIESDSMQSIGRVQRKLSINQLLTTDNYNLLTFRDLTPHPTDPGTSIVSTTSGYAYPPVSAAAQEWWARKDRQRMARDIYVMLYLLGHGDDTVATATTANTPGTYPVRAVYSDAQMREMAQFAVNLVDSMDRDSVMTRFEYDKDLSDGWNLDDDAYGFPTEASPYALGDPNYNASYPNDSASRGEVFGIERLDLAINESLVIQAKQGNSNTNYSQTNFDESMSDRYFFYMEVANNSPFQIQLDAKETYQFVLRQEANGADVAWERALTIMQDPNSPGNPIILSNATPPLVIGSADGSTAVNAFKRSTFAVDPAWSGAPSVRTIPNKAGSPTNPDCDVDVVEAQVGPTPTPTSTVRIVDETVQDRTTTVGAMLSAFIGGTPVANPSNPIRAILRRRAHPTRSLVTAGILGAIDPTAINDNPYVEIDSMTLTSGNGFQIFNMGASPSASVAATELPKLKSIERIQPLDASTQTSSTGSGVATTVNTFGAQNSVAILPTLWQVHFDRSYASVMDLLNLPIVPPSQLTAMIRSAYNDPPEKQLTFAINGSMSARSAAAKFLLPEHPTNAAAATPTPSLDNRWHRILELLEVPTRTNVNLGIGTAMSIPRVPGRINLNTLQYPENLAALIDDSKMMTLNLASSAPVDPDAPSLDDVYEGITRDWWAQFIRSRDSVDPYAAVANAIQLPLPGLANASSVNNAGTYLPDARPFQSISDVGYKYVPTNAGVRHASVADTILRQLPVDSALGAGVYPRSLFEIGTSAEHQTGTVDPYIRNRILSKIYGNTTTRSNCFAIFISVKNFQAAQLSTGEIQIGGPVNGTPNPEYRGFFVVDRSMLESGQTSRAPTFDFRSFLKYRFTLQTP